MRSGIWLLVLMNCLGISVAFSAVTLIDPPTRGTQYETLRFRFEGTLHYANPFDLITNVVMLHVKAPGLPETAIAFFYDGLTTEGVEQWEARFTPTRTGTHTFSVDIDGTTHQQCDVQIEATQKPRQGNLSCSDQPGALRFATGEEFRGIGLNVCWAPDYAYYFSRMQAAGITVTRIWLAPWHLPFEWKETGLGRYDLASARRLDTILTLAARHGIYVMLCMDYHGIARKGAGFFNEDRWIDNPYNAANGGPCARREELFTNAAAKRLFKQKYTYIVSRYGYSPNILLWEFYNEADLMAGEPIPMNRWHSEMAEFVHATDPHHHLVSTSATRSYPEKVIDAFQSPAMDIVMYHSYNTIDLAPYVVDLHDATVPYYRKPVILAEFGVEYRGADRTARVDPYHAGLHNAIWAGWFSETPVVPMSWWWDNYIDPLNLWSEYAALSRFTARMSFSGARLAFAPLPPAVSASGPPKEIRSFGRLLKNGNAWAAWWKNDAYQWALMGEGSMPAALAPSVQTISGLAPGRYAVQWYDPQHGADLGTSIEVRTDASGTLALDVPSFVRDIACTATVIR
jgi:hypothetical protein